MEPQYPDYLSIAHLPTSIEHLERLSKQLGGPRILIKRDDQTGLATGGNKTRKLEYLVAEALAQGCDALITTGAPQSNHCRQTAAAAARFGLSCSLVLRGHAPQKVTGNLQLDELLGAHIYWTADRPGGEVIQEVAKSLKTLGKKPYIIPLGGSNVVGATGYVKAMQELTEQLGAMGTNVDFIVFASSSGGTQAGLVLGAHVYGFQGKVYGISVDHPADVLSTQVAALTTATATHLGLELISVGDKILVNDDYLGEGYAQVGELEREAIRLVARTEGILLDPVYTGRAMGGLIDLIRWGAFTRRQTVLFWHTGGTAALPAFADKLL
ncbi:MAG: D-cysteine desulfhydrase family protein [Candidatus Promineifilaceae bacterium]|nr:D-cysteine desulfhydrase family protein [Candidatus Promineifilaceae bacterium]